MSKSCNIVRGLGAFMTVLGIVCLAVGLIMFFDAQDAASVTTVDDPVITAQVLGGVMAGAGVLYAVAGLAGFFGAKHPAKLTPFIVLATVVAFINLFEVAMTFSMDGGEVWQNILLAVVAFTAAVYACRARQDARAE